MTFATPIPLCGSAILGHARASITLDVYSHINPDIQKKTMLKIDDLVTPIPISDIEINSPQPEPVQSEQDIAPSVP